MAREVDDGRSQEDAYRDLEEVFVRMVAEMVRLVDDETEVWLGGRKL